MQTAHKLLGDNYLQIVQQFIYGGVSKLIGRIL